MKTPLNSELVNLKDKQMITNWFESSVQFSPLSSTDLNIFYNSYVNYVVQKYESVPLSKKRFSSFIKNLLKNYIDQSKVKIRLTSKLQFDGIKLQANKSEIIVFKQNNTSSACLDQFSPREN